MDDKSGWSRLDTFVLERFQGSATEQPEHLSVTIVGYTFHSPSWELTGGTQHAMIENKFLRRWDMLPSLKLRYPRENRPSQKENYWR